MLGILLTNFHCAICLSTVRSFLLQQFRASSSNDFSRTASPPLLSPPPRDSRLSFFRFLIAFCSRARLEIVFLTFLFFYSTQLGFLTLESNVFSLKSSSFLCNLIHFYPLHLFYWIHGFIANFFNYGHLYGFIFHPSHSFTISLFQFQSPHPFNESPLNYHCIHCRILLLGFITRFIPFY